jgi:dihydrofolate reductase
MSKQHISLIAAMSENRAIGYQNRLPWGHLPADWAYLYAITASKKMIMGRKSYEAADRVWSEAGNIVVSRQKNLALDAGFTQAESLDDAIEQLRGEHDFFIIGGEQIFRQAILLADKIYLTLVHETFEGDAFFPDIDPDAFKLVSQMDFKADMDNPYDYSFLVYERRT